MCTNTATMLRITLPGRSLDPAEVNFSLQGFSACKHLSHPMKLQHHLSMMVFVISAISPLTICKLRSGKRAICPIASTRFLTMQILTVHMPVRLIYPGS